MTDSLTASTCLFAGRGATEIDMIEVMAGPPGKLPMCSNDVGELFVLIVYCLILAQWAKCLK